MKFLSVWITVFLTAFSTAPAAQSAKPNIVVILADDFGWGSSTPYGAKGLNTPNLDRLAREGRRFTHAYTPSSVCTPTRYALVTGRYCWRTSLNHGGVANTLDPLRKKKLLDRSLADRLMNFETLEEANDPLFYAALSIRLYNNVFC